MSCGWDRYETPLPGAMAIEVDPTIDAAFTACFFREAATIFGALLWQTGSTIGYTVAPVSAAYAALLLACATLSTVRTDWS